MGSRITVPGYFGDKGLGFDPLVRRGLKYLNFYGEADKTGRNLAPDGVAATVLGSPVVQENGVQFTPAGTLLDTGILQSADFTFSQSSTVRPCRRFCCSAILTDLDSQAQAPLKV